MARTAVVQFLVSNGAKMDVRDKYQQTPLSIASGERLPWIPYGDELGEIIQPSTRDLLSEAGRDATDGAGLFQAAEPKRAKPTGSTALSAGGEVA